MGQNVSEMAVLCYVGGFVRVGNVRSMIEYAESWVFIP